MAVTRKTNTTRITANGDTFSGVGNIVAINYVAGTASPSAQLRVTNGSGDLLFSANLATSSVSYMPLRLEANEVYYVALVGTGTELILYHGID
jgi:hypothetical protein